MMFPANLVSLVRSMLCRTMSMKFPVPLFAKACSTAFELPIYGKRSKCGAVDSIFLAHVLRSTHHLCGNADVCLSTQMMRRQSCRRSFNHPVCSALTQHFAHSLNSMCRSSVLIHCELMALTPFPLLSGFASSCWSDGDSFLRRDLGLQISVEISLGACSLCVEAIEGIRNQHNAYTTHWIPDADEARHRGTGI
jgi:hypothetical protein